MLAIQDQNGSNLIVIHKFEQKEPKKTEKQMDPKGRLSLTEPSKKNKHQNFLILTM